MKGIEEKILKYRDSIKEREISDAVNVYYYTKDCIIRDNIVDRYYPLIKKIIDKRNLMCDKDDLFQDCVLLLYRALDNYSPSNKTQFTNYIFNNINHYIEMCELNREDNISLSSIDIKANNDLEEDVIDRCNTYELLDSIYDLFMEYENKRHVEIFKYFYGLGRNRKNSSEIAKMYNISHQAVLLSVNKLLLFLYFKLHDKFNFYPSDKVIGNIDLYSSVIKYKDRARCLRFSTMDSYEYIQNNDDLSNSHLSYRKM